FAAEMEEPGRLHEWQNCGIRQGLARLEIPRVESGEPHRGVGWLSLLFGAIPGAALLCGVSVQPRKREPPEASRCGRRALSRPDDGPERDRLHRAPDSATAASHGGDLPKS